MFAIKYFKSKLDLPNLHLLTSLGIFSILMLYSFGSIPYLDGNIDFVKTHDFFSGSFKKLFENWTSVHPPGKGYIAYFSFASLGVSRFSYTLIGLPLGILGIVLFYLLASELFGKYAGRVSALLLATNSLFLSVGVFSLTDYLLTIFSIGSFYFYLKRKYILLTIFLSLTFLSKETGILIPLSIIFVEALFIIVKRRTFVKNARPFLLTLISSLIPIFTAFLWYKFLKRQDKPLWSDWNFSDTASQGSVYTIIHNLTSFSFLNKYAYQNWLHLFILNFNWVYWLAFSIGAIIFIKTFLNNKKSVSINQNRVKTVLIMLIFSLIYFFSVLTFQTYTIPRYILPIIPPLILGTSWALFKIKEHLRLNTISTIIPLFLIIILSLFSSSDPVSTIIWGKENIYGENIYALRKNLSGNDGITYNMQYANIVRKRTNEILNAKNASVIFSNDCHWLFPDPNNDRKTMEILKLNTNPNTPCSKIK